MSADPDFPEIWRAERQERQARIDAELAELAGGAPAAVQAEPVPQVATVLPFRRPTKWPHPWQSKTPWLGGEWNAGKVWQGQPRVLISNRTAHSTHDDDDLPPMAA